MFIIEVVRGDAVKLVKNDESDEAILEAKVESSSKGRWENELVNKLLVNIDEEVIFV